MYVSIFAVVLTIIVILLSRRKKRKNQNGQSGIPGPTPVNTKEGCIPDLIKAGSLYHFLSDIHFRYGPVVQFWLGKKLCVSTCSPAAYKDQMKIFNKPENTMEFMSPVFGHKCIQFVNGEEAKLRRQRYDEYLGQFYVRMYIPTIKQVISEMAVKLANNNDPLNVYNTMFHLSCKAVGCTMFGEYFQDDEHVENFRQLYEKFWPLLETNFSQGMPKEGRKEKKEFDQIVSKVMKIVERLKCDRERACDRKFIDVVMETGPDTESIIGDILSYLVGGFHSTSITLTWCLYFAGKYPHLQEKIHKEISELMEDDDTIEQCFTQMRYLRQFINETLRIRFVAPVTTRAAESRTTIGGYDIPQGTEIFQALSVTMTDEKLWPDPKRFDPERFSSENSRGRNPLTFCPFGFSGKRMCPGQKFFYAESMIFLGTLFRKFKFELISKTEVPITYGLLTRPTSDIFMTIRNR